MKKMMFAILALSLVAAAFRIPNPVKNTNEPPQVINSDAKSRIDAMMKSYIASNKTMGLSALILEKGKEVYFNAVGYADKEANIPMNRNTIVRIFSMTKPIVGVALMTLYEKGKFKLDDPLSKYAPEFSNMKVFAGSDANGNPILVPAKRQITIRDITRHTAGFAAEGNSVLGMMVRKADVMNLNNTLAEMAKRLASLPLAFHPGDQWAYGQSVDVQAYLVEKLSGKPFDQYLQEVIFNPLKMTHTGYYVPESERKNFAAVYNRNRETGTLTRQPDSAANLSNTNHWTLTRGGAGLTSTIDDYMRFAQMLLHQGQLNGVRILKPETVKLMATNHLSDTISKRMWLPDRGQVGFGIDFAVRLAPPKTEEENNGIVGEFFWDGALSTLFWVDPKNELTAVLFTQLNPYDQVKLHNSFRDAVYGEYHPQTLAGDNKLTDKEKKQGWELLFDGKSMSKWRTPGSDSFPSKAWVISNGTLFLEKLAGQPSGGDIITREQFNDFELTWDFKLTEGANSGVKYDVHIYNPPVKGLGSALGPEYQLLDDDKHPDAKLGRNGNRKLGSLYDILPSSTGGALHPIGEWNTARVIAKGNHVEHWLNGVKVLEYEKGNDVYNEAFAHSKFTEAKDYGKREKGHILIQDHGNKVFFKNIKIRKIGKSS